MSAHLVDAEHIHVMIHAALTYGGGANGNLTVVTDDEPTPYNGVQQSFGCNVRVLRRGTESAFGQMLLDANVASVNALYKEDEAYVYTYQRPEHFDWEPVEILGAINGYEYQACETSDWITSEAKAFCDRLRKLAGSHLPNASDAPWTISPGDMPLHKRLAAEKRANRA